MASDFPSDLIREIQTSLRRAAGMPFYDPGDPDLPSVPSIEEAVASTAALLPDHLRCKICHGGLCRGIKSTLCIFCGAEPRVEGMPFKISFNSTAACRNFLRSLNLDGSEMTNLDAESKESRPDQNSPKGGVTLSNLLDLELIWPRNAEESHNISSLSGINLDNFFSDQKNEVFSMSTNSDTTQDEFKEKAGKDTNEGIADASKYKLDMLLAQMPDLSFMLEESLFIPKKPTTSEPNT